MPANSAPFALFRRLVVACVCGLVLVSCGREPVGPSGSARLARAIALQPVFPPAYQQVAGAADLAPFSRVRVVFLRASGSTALDSLIEFPATSDSLSLNFAIALADDAPDSGEQLSVLIYCLDAAGNTMFTGGPVHVTALPRTALGTNNAVVIPLTYSGAGATAVSVRMNPRTTTVAPGDPFIFSATALDRNGQIVAGAPISFRVVDGSIAALGSAASGAGRATLTRGSTWVIAQLITGAADSATLIVNPPPAGGSATKLAFASQPSSATAGATIAPVVTVKAEDALGNLVPAYSGPVTLSVTGGTAGATLAGTATVNAVNGVANFTDISVRQAAAGYRLAAASGTLAPDTSVAFRVAAAPAASLTIAGGNGQTGSVSAPLGTPLSASVTDAFGNPVSLVTVQFAIATGGGTLSSTAVPTNALGIASTTWTLGTATGAAAVTATAAAIAGTSITFSATEIAGGASHLAFTVQPTNAVAGTPIAPGIVLQVKDAAGNPATSFTGTVSLTLGANGGGATLNGTTSVNASGGIATFSAVSLNKAASGYTLVASGNGLTSDTSTPFAITSGAAATIAATGGTGQTGLVASALPTPLAVKVTDAFSNPVSGTTVSWAVTSGGGSLSSATSTTSAAGVATVTWTLGSTAGAGTVTATAAGLAGSPISFGAASISSAATKLVIVSQPTNVASGASMSPAVVVQARDASNNLVSSFNGSVALSIGANPGGATLGGASSISASGGVATFTGLSLNKTGAGYTLVATAGGLTSDTSTPFAVSSGPAATLAISAGNNQVGAVLTPLPSPVSVLVADANGNPAAGTVVSWAVATGGGSLSATTSTTNASGIASTSWTLGALAGTQTITATAAGLAGSPATLSATGTAGIAAKLVITTQPGSVVAGVNLAPSIVVSAEDVSGNIAAGFTGAVSLALSSNPSAASLLGTTTVNAVAGMATFTNVSLTKAATGYRIGVSSGTLLQDNSAPFAISAAAAATATATTGNNQSAGILVALGTPLGVLVTDAYANPVAGGAVNWSVSTGGGVLAGATTTTDAAGAATNSWTLGGTLGAQSVTATAAGLATAPVTFNATAVAGVATTLMMAALPATSIAGAPIGPSIVVTARDANGNIAAGFTGAVRIQMGSSSGGADVSGTTTVNAVAGVATFNNVAITKAGSGYTVVGSTNGGVQSVTSNAFSIVAAAPATITKTGGDNQSILGSLLGILLPTPLSVQVVDAYGNPVIGATVNWAVTSGNATMSNPTSVTDGSGTANNNVKLGLLAGTVHVTVSVAGVATPVVFTAHGL